MSCPSLSGAEALGDCGACLQALADDVIRRAKSGEYADKTLLLCCAHQSIPHIVAALGLTNKTLHWGLRPESEVLPSPLSRQDPVMQRS